MKIRLFLFPLSISVGHFNLASYFDLLGLDRNLCTEEMVVNVL